jgi:hypothetical protein
MKPCLLAVVALVASWVVLLSPPAVLAQPDKQAELLSRIEQLEKRIVELEKTIQELRLSAKTPATVTEKMLVGVWVIVKADLRAAPENRIAPWTELNLKADGTCAGVAFDGKNPFVDATYRVSGAEITMDAKFRAAPTVDTGWYGRIASVTETELVIAYYTAGDRMVKVRYTRRK